MKAIIALVALIALVIAAVLALKFINKKTTPEKLAHQEEGEAREDTQEKTTQDLMPIADIKGSVLVQKDGTAIAYVKVSCRNNSLQNTQELVRDTEKTATAIAAASSWPMKIIRLQRPVDSTRNIESLRSNRNRCVRNIATLSPNKFEERQKREFELERIKNIDATIDVLEASQRNGGASNTNVYIVLPVEISVANEKLAYNRAVDMRAALSNAGIDAEVLTGPGIVSMIMSYMGDHRTSAQNVNPYKTMTIVRGVHDNEKEVNDVISA